MAYFASSVHSKHGPVLSYVMALLCLFHFVISTTTHDTCFFTLYEIYVFSLDKVLGHTESNMAYLVSCMHRKQGLMFIYLPLCTFFMLLFPQQLIIIIILLIMQYVYLLITRC